MAKKNNLPSVSVDSKPEVVSKKAENKQPSIQRQQIFTIITWLFPFIFFVLLEGGLRLFGYGEEYPLFVESVPNSPYLTQNRDVAKRYFRNTRIVPTANVDFFKKEKDPKTKRIVTLGESSAAGYPYYRGASFPKILEQTFRKNYPSQSFEFVNVSMAAINSYTLKDFTNEILAIKPDAIMIYTGHNEYYGALGGGSSESLGKSPFLINFFLKLQNFRTVQLIRDFMTWVMGWASKPAEGTLMRQMVKEQSIALDSDLYKLGIHQFESNLKDIVGAYTSAGIPVLVSTLAANEADHYPFISENSDVAQLNKAKNLLAQKDTLKAETILKKLTQQFPKSAEVWYLYGKSVQNKNAQTAKTAFVKAKELDLLRFRAPEAFNDIIRAVAKEKGVFLVDGQNAMRDAKGFIGKTVMLEHLHPNIDGYTHLASAFAPVLQNALKFGACSSCTFTAMRKDVLYSEMDSVIATWRIKELLNQWPFKPIGYKNNIAIQANTFVEQAAHQLYNNNGNWYELMSTLTNWYSKNNMPQKAIYNSKALADGYPVEAGSFHLAANLMLEAGAYEEANRMLNRIKDVAPAEEAYKYFTDAGAVLIEQNKFDEAEAFYVKGLEIYPNPTGFKMLGAIYAQRGQLEKSDKDLQKAAAYLEKSIALKSDDPQALYNVAGVYALLKNWDKAHAAVDKVIALQPGNMEAVMLKRQLNGIANRLK